MTSIYGKDIKSLFYFFCFLNENYTTCTLFITKWMYNVLAYVNIYKNENYSKSAGDGQATFVSTSVLADKKTGRIAMIRFSTTQRDVLNIGDVLVCLFNLPVGLS